jgi:hypothetical protein
LLIIAARALVELVSTEDRIDVVAKYDLDIVDGATENLKKILQQDSLHQTSKHPTKEQGVNELRTEY